MLQPLNQAPGYKGAAGTPHFAVVSRLFLDQKQEEGGLRDCAVYSGLPSPSSGWFWALDGRFRELRVRSFASQMWRLGNLEGTFWGLGPKLPAEIHQ